MHTVSVVGRIGHDPEMKYLPSGMAVTNVSIATDDYAGKDDPKHTTWFRLTFWGAKAEAVNQYVKKGDWLAVVGKMKSDEKGNPRAFERKTGEPGASYEMTVDDFAFIGGKQRGEDDGDDFRVVVKPLAEKDSSPF
jgi:single-strand DNA-binding protein